MAPCVALRVQAQPVGARAGKGRGGKVDGKGRGKGRKGPFRPPVDGAVGYKGRDAGGVHHFQKEKDKYRAEPYDPVFFDAVAAFSGAAAVAAVRAMKGQKGGAG